MTLETVKICNSRCVFCTIDQWPKHTPVMPDELYNKIAADIIDHHDAVEQLCLTGCGEPLLDKKLAQRVYQFKSAGLKKVVIISNASLLDENRSKALLDAGLDEIMISLDGLDPVRYASLRKGLDLETSTNNVLQFCELRDAMGAHTAVRMRMEAHPVFSTEDIDEWLDFWRKNLGAQDNVYAKKMHNWGNQIDQYSKSEAIDTPCHVLWSTMNILSDGQVALCCIDFLPKHGLGSLKESSISDVWHGSDFTNVRNIHATGKRSSLGLCSGCFIWQSSEKIS